MKNEPGGELITEDREEEIKEIARQVAELFKDVQKEEKDIEREEKIDKITGFEDELE